MYEVHASPGQLDARVSQTSRANPSVLGADWSVRVQLTAASGQDPVVAEPAPEPAVVDPGPEPHRDWIDSNHGAELENLIELGPSAICLKVKVVGESRNDAASAFWEVNHTARCAPGDTCRTILRLADEGHFTKANALAEERVLG